MLNTTTFQGRLTADPELRYTPRGTAFCTFTIAQNFRSGDTESVTFVPVTAWKGWAENLVKSAKKGSVVVVSGRLDEETWTERERVQKRSRLRIQAREVYHVEPVYAKSKGAGVRSEAGGHENPSIDRPELVEADEEDVPY